MFPDFCGQFVPYRFCVVNGQEIRIDLSCNASKLLHCWLAKDDIRNVKQHISLALFRVLCSVGFENSVECSKCQSFVVVFDVCVCVWVKLKQKMIQKLICIHLSKTLYRNQSFFFTLLLLPLLSFSMLDHHSTV